MSHGKEVAMPQIVVVTDRPDEAPGTVLLREHVDPNELEADDPCARLVERVGWAIVDADEVEHVRRDNPEA
jgi:hypothetical protein